jgi:hypothetical protein
MRVTLLLADSAQVLSNKLYALGVGWTITTSPTAPMAVVVIVSYSDQASESFTLRGELVDPTGAPVLAGETLGEPQPVAFEGEFTTGERQPTAPDDADFTAVIAVNLHQGLPLAPGTKYEWRVVVAPKNGDGQEVAATHPFWTRKPAST